MDFVFRKLPLDIRKYILSYDDHFIMRKGEIVSIIPKTDSRYVLLHFICRVNDDLIYKSDNHYNTKHYFPNLHNYEGRHPNNSDLMQVTIHECNDSVKYSVWIGKQYPTSVKTIKRQNYYYIEYPIEYNWVFIEYEYTRL
jgi:hypothetical protein